VVKDFHSVDRWSRKISLPEGLGPRANIGEDRHHVEDRSASGGPHFSHFAGPSTPICTGIRLWKRNFFVISKGHKPPPVAAPETARQIPFFFSTRSLMRVPLRGSCCALKTKPYRALLHSGAREFLTTAMITLQTSSLVSSGRGQDPLCPCRDFNIQRYPAFFCFVQHPWSFPSMTIQRFLP